MKKLLLILLFGLYQLFCFADTSVGVGQTITITCKYPAERATFEHVSTSNMDYLSISNVEGAAYCTVYGIKEKKNIPILVRYYWTEYLYGHPVLKTDSYTDYVSVEKSAKPTSISISPNPLYINELGGEPTDIYVITTPSSAYSTYQWEVDQYKGNPKAAHLIWTGGQSNKVRADNAGTTYIKVTSAEGLVAEGMIVIRTPGGHYSGKDGNISWDLSEYGDLKITGTGSMKDYSNTATTKAPWRKHADHILTLEISEGITNIGNLAFYECTELISAKLPTTVTDIHRSAFEGCTNLADINIPDKIKSIGWSAFKDCKNIASINIPEGIQSIGSGAFCGCMKLTNISIPEGITSIEVGTFEYAGLNHVVLPSTLRAIKNDAFKMCQLESLELPNNLTSIGNYAFQDAFKDTIPTLYIPDGVLELGNRAFGNFLFIIEKIETVRLPKSCTEIGSCAVAPIKNLIVNWDTPLTSKCTFYDDVYEHCTLWVPKGTLDKYKNAEYWKKFETIKEFTNEWDIIESKTNDVAVTNIELNLSNISMTVGDTQQLTAKISPNNATDKSVTWKSSNTTIATVSTTGLVTAVSEGSATITCTANDGSGVKATCSVNVKKKEDQRVLVSKISLTESSASLTVGSTKQLTATISPSNATDKSVTWKSSNTTVATINTTGLVTAVSEGSATITCTANDGSGVKATCSISVTKKSYSVKDSGVEGNITWVLTTDGTLTLSGKGAMEGYWTHAWEEYKNDIKKIIIEKGLTGIALNAFRDCSSLISVTIPNSVTSIGSYSFCNCSSLTSVTIPNSVKSIESGAFWNCTSLVSVTIPNSVTSIGGWAFMDCISLSSLFIPSSVIEMEYSPFDRCTALTDLQIDKENPSFMIEDGIIFSKDKTTLFFYLYSKKDKSYTIPSTITKLAYGAFSYNPHLTSVIIPNSITSIESASFFRCTGLISVTIPNTVTSIGEQAFEGCQSLSSIYIPNSVELIGESAFWECKNLETVKIGSGVKSIDVMTFGNCSALRTLYCYAATPPILGYMSYSKIGVFDHAGPATLYVPKESVAAYKVADQWKDFKAIMPLENVDPSMTTTVTTSSAGYATFYDSKISYVLPYGLSAQVVTGCANKKLTYTTIATGSSSGIIPKGTAVMLVADNRWAGTYILTATEESASYTGTNYLYGSDTATTTSASGSNYYYKLTNGPSNNSPFGWYWGAANGTTFQIEGHKAWLALPQTMSRSLSFSAEGEATDIDEWQDTDAPAIIYDLQGRCVNEAKGQGLYIQNGKKRIVK